MNTCYGVLLEAVSIQRYIFQSNTLKTNLGASHLIQHEIFGAYLKQSVNEVFKAQLDAAWDAWRETPAEIRISQALFEIGYIGGGNALLLFQHEAHAREVIKNWSRRLLLHAPGVVTAVSVEAFNINEFRQSLNALFVQLRKHKAEFIPQTILPRHGITAECRQSGLSAECWSKEEQKYVSAVTHAKINAAQAARDFFQEAFQNQLQDDYCFPDKFEKLGSTSGEDSHIAVVHIDGNRMAERFQHADSLTAIRELSVSVERSVKAAFSGLVAGTVQDYDAIMKDSLGFDPFNKDRIMKDSLGFDPFNKDRRYSYPMDEDYQKKRLPITPIVLGGDDITFVCDGRLGVYFAKRFIEVYEKQAVSDHKQLTACAGVAIIKTKYPFYRGYQLAEELCASAKKLNDRAKNSEKLISALDFHVSMSGVFGSLEQIRAKHFHAPEGNLLYRPYKLIPASANDEKSLDQILELTRRLKHDFPGSKIKKLQQVLSRSKEAHELFVTEAEFRGTYLPPMPGFNYHQTVFDSYQTIYFDMVELAEFYPRHELEKEENA